MEFNIGDEVEALPNPKYRITNDGWIGTIVGKEDSSFDEKKIRVMGIGLKAPGVSVCPEYFKLISNDKKTMGTTIVDKIKLSMKTEPEKTLIKAGIMNLDESLTSEGKSLLDILILEDYKAKLKEKADLILAEEK